ncbi:heparan-sulfate 6-O-sulfotransferase 3-B [Neoarius graeffei]|uniref:heparan-sulfate 6-O-sulfotransferase 3-B n=1 Tax=Neoarius graeffei TaxID=443677 RepID=UPI00298D1229|nr:heparan-sulfate 6-O-sulfotransferase 3-B [Neoarius graeffei]
MLVSRTSSLMIMNDKPNKLVFIPVLAVLFVMIGYQYICPAGSQSCHLRNGGDPRGPHAAVTDGAPHVERELEPDAASKFNFSERELARRVDFDMKGDDVLVFLHIQKTGGTTFGRHLVRNMRLERPCDCQTGQKKCACRRPGRDESWLFSRFSTGWSCGLHADWTELTNCVPAVMDKKRAPKRKKNFYYITMLRDPVSRYLSEWKHVQRGATWKTSLHMCDGRAPTQAELPSCYSGDDWSGVTLREFMACPHNLANNRQVRMLADLSLVGCYNLSSMDERERGSILLASAMSNLKNMAFYGLTEFQRKTQYLFEHTFRLHFIAAFTQLNSTRAAGVELRQDMRNRIERLNFLDVQLYKFAKELFLQRVQFVRQQERQERRWQHEQKYHQSIRQSEENQSQPTTTEDYASQVARW